MNFKNLLVILSVPFLFGCVAKDFAVERGNPVGVLNALLTVDSTSVIQTFYGCDYNTLLPAEDTTGLVEITSDNTTVPLNYVNGVYQLPNGLAPGSSGTVSARLSTGEILTGAFNIPAFADTRLKSFEDSIRTPINGNQASKVVIEVKGNAAHPYWMIGTAYFLDTMFNINRIYRSSFIEFDVNALTYAEEPTKFFYYIPDDGKYHEIILYPRLRPLESYKRFVEVVNISTDLFEYYRYTEEFDLDALIGYFGNIGESVTNIEGGAGISAGFIKYPIEY